ncbi:MAG TPA: hypothetical protein VII94_04965 [Candidatus Saccharimonadales bacterium]
MTINKAFRKVPEITIVFWIVKLLTTAMGEATSDFLVFKINPYLAVAIGAIALTIALVIQFSARRYIPLVYWLTVAMVAVFGTMAADALHIQLAIPYIVTTILFSVVLTIVFIVWHKTEKTLSIHSINTKRREIFYWLTVLATFALGTAAGDLTAITLGLGYFSSILLFIGLVAIPAIGYWLFKLNGIVAFWIAYILTRPIGASFADWMDRSKSSGGLALGSGHVGIWLTIIIIVFVGYMTLNRKEIRREQTVLKQL